MKETVYLHMSPLMEAIKSGEIEKLRDLLDSGYSPNEIQHYTVKTAFVKEEIEEIAKAILPNNEMAPNVMEEIQKLDREYEDDMLSTPLELAVLENRKDMVRLLIEHGADLTQKSGDLLISALWIKELSMFAFLIEMGVPMEETQETISRLFLNLEEYESADILSLLDKLDINLKKFGGEPLRSIASCGNQMLAEYLLQHGADINYHKPDMVYPYASTPVTEAARHNHFPMVRWLIEHGADITIPDKYGDRPYTVAVQNKNQKMADYLGALEPEDWHNEQEKARQLKNYKLPASMVEYLKTGPFRLEFPDYELIKWAELYSYMDVQEMKWKRKKLLSLMVQMDNYSDYMLLWSPKDKKLWYLDIEHEEFRPLATWDKFIANPGKYLNGMIEGEFA